MREYIFFPQKFRFTNNQKIFFGTTGFTPNPEIKEEEVVAGSTPLEAKNNSDANKITGGRHMNG